MVAVVTQLEIARPRDVVAAFASEPTNAPRWYVNIKSVEWKSEPPLRLGSQVAFVAHFLGRRLAYTYEIIDFVHGARLVMRTAQGPFPMETRYSWTALDANRTLMTLENHGEPRGFSKLMAPLVEAGMRRANKKDLERLKQVLEREGA